MIGLVAVAFTAATIATMSVAVAVLRSGVSFLPAKGLQRCAHAVAAILACGVSITLGL